MILIIRETATPEQIEQMAEQFGSNFISIINLRPRQQNFSMEVQYLVLRNRIEKIARRLLEVA